MAMPLSEALEHVDVARIRAALKNGNLKPVRPINHNGKKAVSLWFNKTQFMAWVRGRSMSKRQRSCEMLRLHRNGASHQDIADEFGLSKAYTAQVLFWAKQREHRRAIVNGSQST